MTSSSVIDVVLRRANVDDARFVWEVNNHPSVRSRSVSTASIPWEAHEAWFACRLADAQTILFVATCGGVPAAVVRFELRETEATISVAVSAAFRGKGVGARVIALASDELTRARPGMRPVAWVRPDNAASLRAFARAGYVRTGSGEADGVALERLERVG